MAISCDPNDLLTAANCIQSCLTQGQMEAIQTKLLCDIASVFTSGTGGTGPWVLKAGDVMTGALGIGVNPPIYRLDILSVDSSLGLRVTQSAGNAAIVAESYRDSAINHAIFRGRAARGTVDLPTAILAGDSIVSLKGTGYGTAGFLVTPDDASASIEIVADETFITDANKAARIEFRTITTGGGFRLIRMVIKGNGNVGIGPSTTPGFNLDINNGVTPCTSKIYETTDGAAAPTNYSRISLQAQAGNHLIRTESGGTGTLRILQLGTGPSTGTDIAGKDVILHSGQSTGTGVRGAILFQQGTPAGGTGSGVNALATTWSISTAGTWTAADTFNIAFGTSTGTKIGTATNQKLAFWNKAPIIQPTNAIAAAAFVANTSLIANDSATFGGYTIGQIAAALIATGILT